MSFAAKQGCLRSQIASPMYRTVWSKQAAFLTIVYQTMVELTGVDKTESDNMATTKILRDGEDLVVEVPEEILLTLGIGVGQKLHVSLEDNKIILDPVPTDDTADVNQD